MTKDIFNPPFGTLDLIIYVVLTNLGLVPLALNPWAEGLTPDGIAEANAQKLLRHYDGRKITAIKDIRAAFGLGLKDAKEAVEQITETYEIRDAKYYIDKARTANFENEPGEVSFYLRKAEEAL